MEAFMRSKSDPNILSPITNNNTKLENTIDSPKFNFTGLYTKTNDPMHTNNSLRLNSKKFNFTNLPSNVSKIGSLNSSHSKFPITNYISTSTLQSGVASYTIPRQKRFDNKNQKNNSYSSIYYLPEFKSNGITMPQSTRTNSFLKKDVTPSSQDYTFTNLFDYNVKKKKGISISTKYSIKVKFIFLYFRTKKVFSLDLQITLIKKLLIGKDKIPVL